MIIIKAQIYNFGHDINGNPTARISLRSDKGIIFRSKRRTQCGYCSDRAEGAEAKIQDLYKGYDITLKEYSGRRSDGEITATFHVLQGKENG